MSGIVSFATLAAVLLLGWVEGHQVGVGPCPEMEGMNNFVPEQFYGKWFINEIFTAINTCMTLDFSEKAGFSNEIKVNQGRQFIGLDAVDITHTSTYSGSAKLGSGNKQASEMTIKWPASGLFGTMHYTVIDTDYTDYALTFECQSLLFIGRWFSATILSRNESLDQSVLDEIHKKAAAVGIDVSDLKPVSQKNCAKEGEGINLNADPDAYDFNLLGLISDDRIETITTEDEFIKELGNTPQKTIVKL